MKIIHTSQELQVLSRLVLRTQANMSLVLKAGVQLMIV